MKTLKNTLVNNKNNKTINSFSSKLDLSAMVIIKGGEGEDDFWPPTAPIVIDPIIEDPNI